MNKDYGQTYYPLDSDGVDVATYMEQMAESLEGRTVRSFASTTARDDALATLTTEQKKGVLAHVMGKGLYYYTGSQWRYVSAHGERLVQSGFSGITTNPGGQASVEFPIPFGSGELPNVVANHATGTTGVPSLIVRQFYATGFTTNTYFFVYVTQADGTPYGNSFLHISWIAHGPRGAD